MTADKGVPKVLLFLAEGFEDMEAVSIHGAGGSIATMCVGILPVAEAGLLQRKAARPIS